MSAASLGGDKTAGRGHPGAQIARASVPVTPPETDSDLAGIEAELAEIREWRSWNEWRTDDSYRLVQKPANDRHFRRLEAMLKEEK